MKKRRWTWRRRRTTMKLISAKPGMAAEGGGVGVAVPSPPGCPTRMSC